MFYDHHSLHGHNDFQLPSYLRAYPIEFGRALEKLLREQKPVPDLRGKHPMTDGCSDREMFEQTPTGDLWWDASLPSVWQYLYKNYKCKIPSSWEDTIKRFDVEIAQVTLTQFYFVPGVQSRQPIAYIYTIKYSKPGLVLRHTDDM